MGNVFGYVRVSTRDQNEDRQVQAMLEAGVARKCLYIDKQSGKDFERPAYQRLMRRLKSGDTLLVKSLDRLGRNYKEMIEQWRLITQDKGADIAVLDMPLLDSRNKRDLVGTLISDLVLQILSFVAETERQFIRQRQKEGIASAKARGVRFGRKPMKRPASFPALKEQWKRGDISAREVSRTLGISLDTALRWLKET